MNKLKKAEQYVRRSVLAELMRTNVNYLSVLSSSANPLTEEKSKQLDNALRAIVRRLNRIIGEK